MKKTRFYMFLISYTLLGISGIAIAVLAAR
jgi:hypothetical protein